MNTSVIIFLLFFITLLGGLVAIRLGRNQNLGFKHILTFSGAYLFSITLTHILPEIFVVHEHIEGENQHTRIVAIFLLLGFFLQHFLQQFSSGTEHGHFHGTGKEDKHFDNLRPILIAMFLHSFLEGMLLMHPNHEHSHHSDGSELHYSSLLLGIMMHKVPEAFAFTTVLFHRSGNKKSTLILLVLYALCSPLGAISANYFLHNIFSESGTMYLFALVAGSFLHISTTIFFENNPQHLFDIRKLSFILLGASSAIIIDYFLS